MSWIAIPLSLFAVAATFAETFFDLISEAISAADRRQRSCMQNSVGLPPF